MKKVLMIIPYPTRTEKLEMSRRGLAFLIKLLRTTRKEFDSTFQVEFMLRKHPGYMNKKIVFPMKRAKRNTERIPVEDRRVIFFGWNSMRAFDQICKEYCVWNNARGSRAFTFMVLPYPVGSRKWWGEVANRVVCKQFLVDEVTVRRRISNPPNIGNANQNQRIQIVGKMRAI